MKTYTNTSWNKNEGTSQFSLYINCGVLKSSFFAAGIPIIHLSAYIEDYTYRIFKCLPWCHWNSLVPFYKICSPDFKPMSPPQSLVCQRSSEGQTSEGAELYSVPKKRLRKIITRKISTWGTEDTILLNSERSWSSSSQMLSS